MEKFKEHLLRNSIAIVLLLAVGLGSFFGLGTYCTKPENHTKQLAMLDETKTTVMELAAASAAVSTTITMLPGDSATPIAEKLADFSTYFLVVLCAIFLEKYLLTVTAFAAFRLLIPAACVLGILFVCLGNRGLCQLAKKMALLGVLLFALVPASVAVSGMIDETYHESIESTIQAVNETASAVEESTQSGESDEGLLKNVFNRVKDKVGHTVDSVTEFARSMLNRFMEALAMMLVTSCLIPIAVLVLLAWLLKTFLSVELSASDWSRPSFRRGEMKNEE